MADPQRIVLVRLSHLGDVVHALPVYHAVRARYPDARLAWIVQPEFADLVAPLPGLERVIPFGRRDGARAWWRLRRELGSFGAELAIDAQGNLKSAGATWLSRAPRRVGLAPVDWREPVGARVLTETAPPVAASRERSPEGPHAIERMLALARTLAREPSWSPRFDPALSDDERARGRALAERWLPEDGAVVLALGDPGDPRSWPLAHHARLARELETAGTAVLVLSGPGEERHGAALRAELGDRPAIRHWVGQRGLRELAAFFAAAAERGARFVGADSGPMHLAVACGLPVVSLAGPQSHRRTGPWPPPDGNGATPADSPHRVVRTSEPLTCAPCLARRCTHPDGAVCMSTLTPDRVRTAVAAR